MLKFALFIGSCVSAFFCFALMIGGGYQHAVLFSVSAAWLVVPGFAYSFIESGRRLPIAFFVNLPHSLLLLLFLPENYDDPQFLQIVLAPIALGILAQAMIHPVIEHIRK